MSHRICCYTLFDITQTGVLNRSKPQTGDLSEWILKRNTQCNFDTILQVISLRSQPEIIKYPIERDLTEDDLQYFGFLYNAETVKYWKFEFEVQHPSVFENGIISLGALYADCEGVPMLITDNLHSQCPKFLDTSPELKNIHFEVL